MLFILEGKPERAREIESEEQTNRDGEMGLDQIDQFFDLPFFFIFPLDWTDREKAMEWRVNGGLVISR